MKPENDAMPQGNPSSSDPSLNKKSVPEAVRALSLQQCKDTMKELSFH